MGLEREDALGNIKLNDTVFARMLLRAIANTNGKAGLASEKGKLLGGMNQKVSASEAASHLNFWEAKPAFPFVFAIANFRLSLRSAPAFSG